MTTKKPPTPAPDVRKKQFAIIAGRIKLIGSRRSTPEVKALWLEAAAIVAKAGDK